MKQQRSEIDPIKYAMDRAYPFCEEQQLLLDTGRITEEEWFADHNKYFTSHYLAEKDPRGQSGHGGDEERYRYTQEMVLSSIHRSGTFIDVGCANGYLMEKLCAWLEGTQFTLEFSGLDISAELIDLARLRLPEWKDRLHVGNALYWTPIAKYDFACVRELDYVPKARRKAFFLHLANNYLAKGGRLILGPRTEERGKLEIESEVTRWGYPPSGSTCKPHQECDNLIRRLYWFDESVFTPQ